MVEASHQVLTRVPLVQGHGIPPPCDINIEDVHGRHGQAAAAEFTVPAKDGRGHVTARWREGVLFRFASMPLPTLGPLPGRPSLPTAGTSEGHRAGVMGEKAEDVKFRSCGFLSYGQRERARKSKDLGMAHLELKLMALVNHLPFPAAAPPLRNSRCVWPVLTPASGGPCPLRGENGNSTFQNYTLCHIH